MKPERKYIRQLVEFFWMTGLLALIIRFVLERQKKQQAADTVFWIAAGLVIAALILKLIERFAVRDLKNKAN